MPSTSVDTKAGSSAVSPGSKRRFSSNSTPGASSASLARTGSIEYFGSGAPLGRPRWLAVTTVAPRSVNHSIVGSAARIRKSSVIRPSSSSGTLKSVRTNTRLPLRSPSVASRSSSVGIAEDSSPTAVSA
jgi:hypothetical protein